MTLPHTGRAACIRHRVQAAALAIWRYMVPLTVACALAGLMWLANLAGSAGLAELAEWAGLPDLHVMGIITPSAALAQPGQSRPELAQPDMPAPGQDVPGSGGSTVPPEPAPAPTAAASATSEPAHRNAPQTTPPPARQATEQATGMTTGSAMGLAGDSALIIATYDWPPYVEHNLPHGGYVVQLIRAALASVGLEARFEFMPWARAMSLLHDGKVTAVAPAYRTADREIECDLSAPFPGGPLALFALTNNARHWDDLRDLAGLRIGVVRGYAHTQAFDAAAFLRKEPANDETANLRKLLAGRIDAMAADRNVVRFLLRRDLPDLPGLTDLPDLPDPADRAASLAEFDPILGERDLHVCFSRARPDHAALRAAFDKGLAAIRASGLLEGLHRDMCRLAQGQPAGQ